MVPLRITMRQCSTAAMLSKNAMILSSGTVIQAKSLLLDIVLYADPSVSQIDVFLVIDILFPVHHTKVYLDTSPKSSRGLSSAGTIVDRVYSTHSVGCSLCKTQFSGTTWMRYNNDNKNFRCYDDTGSGEILDANTCLIFFCS